MEESEAGGGMTFYDRVYSAARPELFFKSTPHRTVGPGDPVRIRHDSKWNVPEPELTLLVSPKGRILGYTVGNDGELCATSKEKIRSTCRRPRFTTDRARWVREF